MRKLYLENEWKKLGAEFSESSGAQSVKAVKSFDEEYGAMRKTATLCDFSFVNIFSYAEAQGADFLDETLAANILKLRYGRMMSTFLAGDDGKIAAECLVADIDDRLLLIAESLLPEAELLQTLQSESAGFENMTGKFVMLSVDGPMAWKAAGEVFGSDILNLSYMGVERHDFEGEACYVLRGGKTGEFGYQFIAPNSVAEKLFEKTLAAVEAVGGSACGLAAHFNARLEGGFFNIYAEGAAVGNPLSLGLQWMTDFGKEKFRGSAAICAWRNDKNLPKLVCLRSDAAQTPPPIGAEIFNGAEKVGEVVAGGRSPKAQCNLALALFDRRYAYAGFDFSSSPASETRDLATMSRPAIITMSLETGLDQA